MIGMNGQIRSCRVPAITAAITLLRVNHAREIAPSVFNPIKGVKPKRPYAIGMKSGEPFALAGIWENWQRPGTDEWVRSFAIITTNANELVGEIHDRMPVIIPPESYDRWLSTLDPDPRDLLVSYPAGP